MGVAFVVVARPTVWGGGGGGAEYTYVTPEGGGAAEVGSPRAGLIGATASTGALRDSPSCATTMCGCAVVGGMCTICGGGYVYEPLVGAHLPHITRGGSSMTSFAGIGSILGASAGLHSRRGICGEVSVRITHYACVCVCGGGGGWGGDVGSQLWWFAHGAICGAPPVGAHVVPPWRRKFVCGCAPIPDTPAPTRDMARLPYLIIVVVLCARRGRGVGNWSLGYLSACARACRCVVQRLATLGWSVCGIGLPRGHCWARGVPTLANCITLS